MGVNNQTKQMPAYVPPRLGPHDQDNQRLSSNQKLKHLATPAAGPQDCLHGGPQEPVKPPMKYNNGSKIEGTVTARRFQPLRNTVDYMAPKKMV
jgi:hypothetical protein